MHELIAVVGKLIKPAFLINKIDLLTSLYKIAEEVYLFVKLKTENILVKIVKNAVLKKNKYILVNLGVASSEKKSSETDKIHVVVFI